MIMRFKSRYLVLWLLGNLMVYKSMDKEANYAGGRHITPVHPICGKLHCWLIIFLGYVSIR